MVTTVDGDYMIETSGQAYCSEVGEFMNDNPPPQGPVIDAPVINQGGVIDNTTSRAIIFVGSSGTMSIYGFWLTADGQDPNPTITIDDPNNIRLGSPTYISDQQINLPYSVTYSAAIGIHTISVTTPYGTSNPAGSFTVGPAVQVTPGPTTILSFTSGPDVRGPQSNCVSIQANGQPSG